MAKYAVTYSCGHEAIIQLYGKQSERDYRLEREALKLCPQCYYIKLDADRKAASEKNAAENQEAGLPALEGSEKQIAWAETIRASLLRKIDEAKEKNIYYHYEKEELPEVFKAIEMIKKHADTKWWIENREKNIYKIINEEIQSLKKAAQEAPVEVIEKIQKTALELKAEATIYPTNKKTENVAEIQTSERSLMLSSPKNEYIRTIVKRYGMAWDDRFWVLKLGQFAGEPQDRLIELGIHLLSKGIPICCFDETVRQKIVAGEFEPECKTWIYTTDNPRFKDCFLITWGKDQDYWQVSKRIYGSKWHGDVKLMVVPASSFDEVKDFADKYGFKMRKKAIELYETAKEAKSKALVVDVKKKPVEKIPVATKPGELQVPDTVEIAYEFKD